MAETSSPRAAERFLRAEGRLLLAVALLVGLSNVPYGNYILYPFSLFGTWVHEACHALAALAMGGRVDHIEIFPDTSGLAWTATSGRLARATVSSAGYVGTALGGGLLLVFRRRELAGRIGLALLGALMLLSVLFWVRNAFGLLAVGTIGGALLIAGLRLPTAAAGTLYAFLAAATALNSITSIQNLFGSVHLVNGQAAGSTDARTVGELLLLPWWAWASGWFVLALASTGVGLRWALPESAPRQ
ncbi:MAG: M50 family metallopeptidase [Deltaproteobacteria bacterium]|nr:M50 family metallopeptidase [Deltaproteobacteria bacterium]